MELSGYKFKIRAYMLDCEVHMERNRKINELHPNIDIPKALKALGVELIQNMKYKQMLEELVNKDFLGYSTLMFIIDFECFCDLDFLLSIIYEHINSNVRLRCITKIVLTYSYIILECSHTHIIVRCKRNGKKVRFHLPNETQMRNRFPDLKESAFELLRETPSYILIKLFDENAAARKMFVGGIRLISNIKAPLVDNLIIIHCKKLGIPKYFKVLKRLSREKTIFLKILEHLFEFAMKQSIQQMMNDVMQHCKDTSIYEEVANFSTTTAGAFYFFNINPALAIVINHMTFPKLKFRQAAEKDIESLSRVCTLKKIPHIIVRDGSAEQVQELMHLIQTTDLSLLKYLFVFVMGHGDEGDTIYTKSTAYAIDEHIKDPLCKNSTLKNVEKFLLINACRGQFNPDLDCDDQPLEITDVSSLDEHTSVLYSARKGCVSLRAADGSVCIQKFCEVFEKYFQQYSLLKLHENIELDLLSEWSLFDSVTEYCSKPDVDHILKMEFDNFSDFKQLYEKFENYVKSQKF